MYAHLTRIMRGILSNFLSQLRTNAVHSPVLSRSAGAFKEIESKEMLFLFLFTSSNARGERRDLWTVEFAVNEARRR